MLHDFCLFLPIPTLLKLPSPALVSLLIPPLTLPIPILLGFHTCVRPHFSISKIIRGGSKFQCKILKVAWMQQLLTFCMHSLWFFFSPVCTEQKRTTLQGNPNFFEKILPWNFIPLFNCSIMVNAWKTLWESFPINLKTLEFWKFELLIYLEVSWILLYIKL